MHVGWVVSYYKPAYVYGGPVTSNSALCEALVDLGAEVTVLTTNANGTKRLDVPLSQLVVINGVEVWYFPLALQGLSFFYSPALVCNVKQQVMNFDLVVSEVMWGHAFGPTTKVCAQYKIPYVIPVRGQLMPWALRHHWLKKKLFLLLLGKHGLNHAAALLCTDIREDEAVARLGLHSPRLLIPNGIDIARFQNMPAQGSIRQKLGIPDEAIVLLFLGRLKRIKRPDIAISALAAAIDMRRPAHLILAGPDEDGLSEALQSQARSLSCGDRVHFTGLLSGDDVLCVLADADLLLMPSEVQENFGMAAVEAMAAGVPVLVSDGIPVGRWAQMAGAGVSVPSTPEQFSRALANLLLATPGDLKAMGEHGRLLARERFGIRMVARDMLAQFEAIATTGRPRA